MINKLIIFCLLISFNFFSKSIDVLQDFNKGIDWVLIEERLTKKIFDFYNIEYNCNYLRIEQPIDINYKKVFNLIKDIDSYNDIISNKTIQTKLVGIEKDTIFAYQRINNSLPFTRDRQYVFKMYNVSEKKIVWSLVDKDNKYLFPYLSEDMHTLTFGAGSWHVENNKENEILVNTIYVDDEVNLPNVFINKLRRNHVIDIFDDVLNSMNKKGD